jgi:hypothetical protein
MEFWLIVGLAVGAIITVLVVASRRERLRAYGDAWRQYNAGAFHTTVEASHDERFEIVTRLADELTTGKGQLAVSMKGDRGWALHHVNKNGTFAKRGPYYVSMYRGTWQPTGRKLLIRTLRGKKRFGFHPEHYLQRGIVYEKGLAVLEYGTQRYPPMSLGEFVAMQRRNKHERELHGSRR